MISSEGRHGAWKSRTKLTSSDKKRTAGDMSQKVDALLTLAEEMPMLKRVLAVDLDELEVAFEDHGFETGYFLDLQTGDVVAVTDEIRSSLEKIYGKLPEDTDLDSLDWPLLTSEHGWPEWMAGALEDANRVEIGFGTHYIRVPKDESRDGYQDMEEFIAIVSSARLQDRLEQAISGKGAFRRFKDVLVYHESERERWFAFKRDRVRARMLEWLEDEGIEATPRQ
jgi:Uncharacterised protein family (UPF0158)